ncbi:hypothetical protein TrRE_jg10771, partial [Triparma retinervis]
AGAGFKLDITASLPTTSTIPTAKAPQKPGTAGAHLTTSTSIPKGWGAGESAKALFDDDNSIGSFSFHAAGSAVRTKKITSFSSTKDHFAQEPFERFSAHKVREVKEYFPLASSRSEGTFSLPGRRPKLKDRLPIDTYLNATPPGSRSKPKGSSLSEVALLRKKEKHMVEEHAIHDHQGGQAVTMGLFKGVTVAGGGKRLSVMAPVVPKSEKQLETDHFKKAYAALMEMDETSIERQSVFVEDVMEAMKKNGRFRGIFMGTVVWPVIKMKRWEEMERRLKDNLDDFKIETIRFDGFLEFLRGWYTEMGVCPSSLRRDGEDTLLNGEWVGGGLRKETATYKVGDAVEARASGGPFWLPGVVCKAEGGTYGVKYDLVSAWRTVHNLREVMARGGEVFKRREGGEGGKGEQLVLTK